MVVQILGIWKFLKYASIIIGAGMIVFSILSSAIVGFSGGGWDDFARATGGRLLNADRDNGITTDKLLDVQANPQNYDGIDVDNMKSRIWYNFGIFAIIFYVLFWFGVKIWDGLWHDVNFATYVVVGVITVLILGGMQFGWLVYESKVIDNQGYLDKIHIPEAIPFYGTFHFFRNVDVMKVTGTKDIAFEEIVEANLTESSDVLNIGIG